MNEKQNQNNINQEKNNIINENNNKKDNQYQIRLDVSNKRKK